MSKRIKIWLGKSDRSHDLRLEKLGLTLTARPGKLPDFKIPKYVDICRKNHPSICYQFIFPNLRTNYSWQHLSFPLHAHIQLHCSSFFYDLAKSWGTTCQIWSGNLQIMSLTLTLSNMSQPTTRRGNLLKCNKNALGKGKGLVYDGSL